MHKREAIGEAAGGGLGRRLSALVQSGEKWVDRLGVSIKEAGRSVLVKQAVDARERGNIAASFWLLKEEYEARPESPEVALLFWDVAVSYERPVDAVAAVAELIRRHAGSNDGALAAQYWSELVGLVPDALVDPGALVRIVPTLRDAMKAEEDDEVRELRRYLLVKAMRTAVDEANTGLGPGLAFRLSELAREIDPPAAVAAARVALASQELHAAKRERLVELVTTLGAEVPRSVSAVEEEPEEEPTGDPAKKHPLRTESPTEPALSETEIVSLRARLPRASDGPRRRGCEVSVAPGAPALEIDPDDDGTQPDLEIDALECDAEEEEVARAPDVDGPGPTAVEELAPLEPDGAPSSGTPRYPEQGAWEGSPGQVVAPLQIVAASTEMALATLDGLTTGVLPAPGSDESATA